MSLALYLFELFKMSNHWSCITFLSIEAGKKIEAKMWKKNKKKVIMKHNFKIPRAHVYPQTTSKMPLKFQKHLLKALGGVVLTRSLLLYVEACKKCMLKVNKRTMMVLYR